MHSILHWWRNKRRHSSKPHLQPSKQQKYNLQIYRMQHKIQISKQYQQHKNLNQLLQIKGVVSNSQITKIKTVNLILRIVAVQMEHLRQILHQVIAHQPILHQVIVLQEILHLPIKPNKIKPHLPQITGSYKISHIYKMIL